MSKPETTEAHDQTPEEAEAPAPKAEPKSKAPTQATFNPASAGLLD